MAKLFSPLTIREITFRNRIAISPMCQYSAVNGYANNWHLVHLGSRAVGGAGLIIQEATAVVPEGRISPGDLGIWQDSQIAPLTDINRFIKSHGSVPGIQLAHAGRKASTSIPWKGSGQVPPAEGGWQTVAPSPIPFSPGDSLPEELDSYGIRRVITSFADAAERALAAEYQLIEIHAAHGYLLNQFLSPLTNKRSDNYGGSFENRIRLLVEVTDAIREVWPERLPLFVRISATDWADGGWDIADSVRLAGILKEHGVDLIDCSSGGSVPGAKIPAAPGYQVPFAERIKKESGIMTGAVGLITTALQAEEILGKDQADLILIARASLRDPYFPMNAAKELNAEIQWPGQYLRGK
ncbi:MAG: NADH:flavin oxidoreductase/NADH oxidase [Ignavibacteriaceae bacterium]|nr:NADH:flavin oxidoreductase/NADH oxidase [Ignavibacteriaceae bacterium]